MRERSWPRRTRRARRRRSVSTCSLALVGALGFAGCASQGSAAPRRPVLEARLVLASPELSGWAYSLPRVSSCVVGDGLAVLKNDPHPDARHGPADRGRRRGVPVVGPRHLPGAGGAAGLHARRALRERTADPSLACTRISERVGGDPSPGLDVGALVRRRRKVESRGRPPAQLDGAGRDGQVHDRFAHSHCVLRAARDGADGRFVHTSVRWRDERQRLRLRALRRVEKLGDSAQPPRDEGASTRGLDFSS